MPVESRVKGGRRENREATNNARNQSKREDGASESESEGESMAEECGKCDKKVCSNGIQCDDCDVWFHNGCAKISKEQSKVLNEVSGCKWFCGRCKGRQRNLQNENSKLREKYEEVRNRLENFELIISSLKDEISKLTNKIGQGRDETVGITLEEVRNEVREEFKEQHEKEKRKNNIVMYNIKESTKNEYNEKLRDDFETCGEIINKELGMSNIEIVEVTRMGRVGGTQSEADTNTEADRDERGSRRIRPRPILVKLRSPGEKWGVISQGKRLRNSEDESMKNVFIAPDLTKKEREHENKLRDELQRKKENGELGWYIKKGELRRNERNFQGYNNQANRY